MAQAEPDAPPAPPPAPRRSWLVLASHDIKLAHSIFALPFAILGAFLARGDTHAWARFAWQLALVVVCMVLARTWAMLFNRIADRRFDAANPRTARRAVASGALPLHRAWSVALASAALFMLAALAFGPLFGNFWPILLAAPVLGWIAFYSLTKRFTALCHLVLGTALAASPLAAALAIEPATFSGPAAPCLWWLAAMVALWVAGFDVIYALQDIDFDRGAGLRSIPARVGWRGGAWAARILHGASAVALVLAWRAEPRLGWVFGAGVVAVLATLVLEHAVLARRGKLGLDMAFFTLNGVVSCLLGATGVIDLLI